MATKVKRKLELSLSLALGLIALAASYYLWHMAQGPGQSLIPHL
jgi:hypothetical protein